ncbi:hypothetical protein NQ176_g227 [Zarea fungicola]|uniref:Uncharacterized protein n=1 Tax=Zarea fungicola TaxID=93591 RepID=A0ACC1P045_9HYPO|nr:hypothetical protein NQ176_g227 [Lecanicillium fungicola]
MLELRIWHHFVTDTYQSLLQSIPGANDAWKNALLELALSGKTYLADAILAISALHLQSLNPNDTALELASHVYSASALADYRSSLTGGIDEENAEALLLTACLIAFKATASRILINAKRDESHTGYPLPLAWFHAFQGIKTIAAVSWPWVSNSATVGAVINSQIVFQLDFSFQCSNSFFGHLLEDVEDEFLSEDPLVNSMSQQGYVHAVSVLNWAHQSPYPLAALAFPAAVSNRFVQLLEAKQPRALAIVACFFALLKRIERVWWLGDVARREVTGIIGMFKPGSAWWRHLEWPIPDCAVGWRRRWHPGLCLGCRV